MKNTDRCAVSRCRRDADLTYLDKPVCNFHWERLGISPYSIRLALGLEPPTTEDDHATP